MNQTLRSAGPCLLELIDQLEIPKRLLDKPFRMVVADVFKHQALGLSVSGKVESGAIVPREELLLMPSCMVATVKGIQAGGTDRKVRIFVACSVFQSVCCRSCPFSPCFISVLVQHDGSLLTKNSTPTTSLGGAQLAKAGDSVDVGLRDVLDERLLMAGQILCDPSAPVPMVQAFRAQIMTLDYKVPLFLGSTVVVYTQVRTWKELMGLAPYNPTSGPHQSLCLWKTMHVRKPLFSWSSRSFMS